MFGEYQMEKQNISNTLLMVALIMCITIGSLFTGAKLYKYTHPEVYKTDTVTVTKSDTVYQTLTHTVIQPQPVKEYIIRYDTITTDSPQTHFNVPITAKLYQDSITLQDSTEIAYNAKISGFNTNLDTISFRLKYPHLYTTTEKTVTVYKQPKINVGISVGAGYGIIHRQTDIYAGISVTVPFTAFSKK